LDNFLVKGVLRTFYFVALGLGWEARKIERQPKNHTELEHSKGKEMNAQPEYCPNEIENLILALIFMHGLGRNLKNAHDGLIWIGRERRHHQHSKAATGNIVTINSNKANEEGKVQWKWGGFRGASLKRTVSKEGSNDVA
jgi:hypothetical protein